jgi:hypothetical protein
VLERTNRLVGKWFVRELQIFVPGSTIRRWTQRFVRSNTPRLASASITGAASVRETEHWHAGTRSSRGQAALSPTKAAPHGARIARNRTPPLVVRTIEVHNASAQGAVPKATSPNR